MNKKARGRLYLFLLLCSVVITIFLVMSVSYYRIEANAGLSTIKSQEALSSKLQQSFMRHEIQSVMADLMSLSVMPYPNNIKAISNSEANYSLDMTVLKNTFLVTLQNKSKYQKIEFINVQGVEITRGDRLQQSFPVVISKNRFIQNPNVGTEFSNTIGLKRGQIYIASTELIDDGNTSLIPILKFATPVFNRESQKSGIIILSFRMNHLLSELSNVTDYNQGHQIMINDEGYYVIEGDNSGKWKYTLAEGKLIHFSDNYPQEWIDISENNSGQFLTKKGLFTYVTLCPFGSAGNISPASFYEYPNGTNKFKWKSIFYIPIEQLRHMQYPHLKLYIQGNIGIVVILVISCWFVSDGLHKRRLSDQLLKEEREKFRTVADFTYDWEYWIGPDGSYVYMSPSCYRISGYTVKDFIQTPDLFKNLILPDDLPLVELYFSVAHLKDEVCHIDFRIRDAAGKEKWIAHTSQPVFTEEGKFLGRRASNADISARKEIELKLAESATHDDLTKLPNRKLLYEEADHILAQAKRNRSKVAILFIDLDNFKVINDELGHEIGDEVLKQVSLVMTDLLRKSDVIARVGGDEFIVILPEIKSIEDSQLIAKKLIKSIEQAIATLLADIQTINVYFGASIGISVYPDDAGDIEQLISVADKSMYKVKRKKKAYE